MLEILAECLGLRRSCWNLPRSLPVVQLGLPADKTPAVGVKIPELFADCEKCACVAHGGLDLHPVANDLRVGGKTLDSSLGVARDLRRIEVGERAAIAFALFQDERPVQAGLCAGEDENLEVFAVTMNGDTPFVIVILDQQRTTHARPGAPFRRRGHYFLPSWALAAATSSPFVCA